MASRQRGLFGSSELYDFARLHKRKKIPRTELVPCISSALTLVLRSLSGTRTAYLDNSPVAETKGRARVTIVYQEDDILPENREAIKKVRDSGVFERMAQRLTRTVALPHDLQVIVTDKTPDSGSRKSCLLVSIR
jgi:hypothetical protein